MSADELERLDRIESAINRLFRLLETKTPAPSNGHDTTLDMQRRIEDRELLEYRKTHSRSDYLKKSRTIMDRRLREDAERSGQVIPMRPRTTKHQEAKA